MRNEVGNMGLVMGSPSMGMTHRTRVHSVAPGGTGENCWSGKGTSRSALQRRRAALVHRHTGWGEIILRRRVRQISWPKGREAIQAGKERVTKGVKLQILFKWLINRKRKRGSSH